MRSKYTKTFAPLVIIGYIFIAVFGLLPMVGMSHNMMNHDTNCPYSTDMQAVCDMGFSHIRGWQVLSNVIIVTIFSILILAIFNLLQPFEKTLLINGVWLKRIRKRDEYTPPDLYQELFSQGILNPKNP